MDHDELRDAAEQDVGDARPRVCADGDQIGIESCRLGEDHRTRLPVAQDGPDLQAAAREWATRLASGPTKAIGWSKQLLQLASEVPRAQLLETEAMLVEMNTHTEDSAEGVASFMERRSPEWKGW